MVEKTYSKLYKEEDLQDHSSINAVIKNSDGMVLMQDHIKYNMWMIISGKVKSGQGPEEALVEEVFEETGLTVISYKLLKCKPLRYIRNDAPISVQIHLYEVIKYNGAPENMEPHKHRSLKFMDLDEIINIPNLSDVTKIWLDHICATWL